MNKTDRNSRILDCSRRDVGMRFDESKIRLRWPLRLTALGNPIAPFKEQLFSLKGGISF
jgi:hypothetical protein